MFRLTLTLLTTVAAAWGTSLWLLPPDISARSFIKEAFYVTGMLSWALWALAMIIAARPAWLERFTGTALDKLYVHHRRLGWAAVLVAFIHYFTKEWMHPVLNALSITGGRRPQGTGEFWQQLYVQAMHASNEIALWLTWAALAVCLTAYIRKLTHSRWLSLHRLLALVTVALAFHCVLAADKADWATPFGWLNAVITAFAVIAAVRILVKGPGSARRVNAKITSAEQTADITTLVMETSSPMELPAGSFVFLGAGKEAPHPFSVVRTEGCSVELAVKALGDWTRDTVPQLTAGTPVTLEGPWGHFHPRFDGKRQTWVAGGIGIAPFMSWLEAAANADVAQHGELTLCWCIRNAANEPLLPRIQELARKAGVTLRVFESCHGRARADDLLAGSPERLAFCGAGSLLRSLKASQHCPADLQNEVFAWRRGD